MSSWFPCRAALVAISLSLTCLSGCESGSKPASETGSKTGGGSSGTKRIIFLTNGNSPFWDACRSGLQAGEKQYCGETGISVVMEVNDGTAQGQIDKLRQFASQSDIVGVALTAVEADNVAIVEEMKNLQAKGVKLITVDGDVDRSKFRDARPYYIGTDNIVGGRVLGDVAKRIMEARKVETGSYVQFAGFTNNDNARSRMNGFQEAVGKNFQEIDRMPDGMDLSKARDNVRNALTNHPNLTTLVGIWSYNAPAIAEVVADRKLRDKVTIVTFDAEAAAIQYMSEGQIDAMVVQNPFDMGVQAVRLIKALLEKDEAVIKEMYPKYGEPDGDIYTTGLRVVAPDDSSILKADMFDSKTVEFMTLQQFKAWLAKYKLTCS